MKVKDLVEQLTKLNQEAQVACHQELISGGSKFFEIDDVKEAHATSHRDDNGSIGLTFGRGSQSAPWAVLNICSGEDD